LGVHSASAQERGPKGHNIMSLNGLN
jgi:hypothetical protein